jgi:hypothetical protein
VQGAIDLLTCNPPFIVQPGGHVTAVATAMEGDSMLEHLARGMPRMLRDGGWATVIGIWEHAGVEDWVSRPAGWVQGCDVLLLRFRTYLPDEYLVSWFPPDMRAGMERSWRDLCTRRGIGAMTYGGVVMRRRAGANWMRALSTIIEVRSGGASEQVRALFDTQTALQGMSTPEEVLKLRLRVAPGWRYDPALPPPKSALPGSPPGLALSCPNAAVHEPMLRAFQGDVPARDVVAKLMAAGMALPDDPAVMVHSWAQNGYLEIADAAPGA